MTREEAKKLLPIIKEYSNGKTVEWFNNVTGKWEELKYPAFDCAASMYRIKPEPKYRPFKSQEEFGYIKRITADNCAIFLLSMDDYIKLGNEGLVSFKDAIDSYTFTDGKPFGIKE